VKKYTKHCLKSLITIFSKIFKNSEHQSDNICQLPPKKQILKRNSQKPNNFLTPSASKKAAFVKFSVKKANLATLTLIQHCIVGCCDIDIYTSALHSRKAIFYVVRQ